LILLEDEVRNREKDALLDFVGHTRFTRPRNVMGKIANGLTEIANLVSSTMDQNSHRLWFLSYGQGSQAKSKPKISD
jgi:hypothetical protein